MVLVVNSIIFENPLPSTSLVPSAYNLKLTNMNTMIFVTIFIYARQNTIGET